MGNLTIWNEFDNFLKPFSSFPSFFGNNIRDYDYFEQKFSDGTVEKYSRGKLHCETGPAVIKPDGTKEYWLNGRQVTEKDLPEPKGYYNIELTDAEKEKIENLLGRKI